MYIFVIIILLVCVTLIYYSRLSLDDYIGPKIERDILLSSCSNGDLVFFYGHSFGEKMIQNVTGSYINHVAMIFFDRDIFTENIIPYIWESDVGYNYRDGPRVMRLIDKLNRYKQKFCIWKRYLGPPIYTDQLLNIIPRYINHGIDTEMLYWLFSNDPNSIGYKLTKKSNTMFCSELIAATLQDLEIINRDASPSSYSPQKLYNDINLYGMSRIVRV